MATSCLAGSPLMDPTRRFGEASSNLELSAGETARVPLFKKLTRRLSQKPSSEASTISPRSSTAPSKTTSPKNRRGPPRMWHGSINVLDQEIPKGLCEDLERLRRDAYLRASRRDAYLRASRRDAYLRASPMFPRPTSLPQPLAQGC